MGLLGLFGKKTEADATLPANDMERWFTAAYAMWSEYAEGDWHYFAGSTEKSRQEGASMRTMLRRDWDVSDRQALLETVIMLTALYEEGGCEEGDIQTGAWDLCRACQILGMGYVGGYIERQEMVAESMKVSRIMQRYYHSWQELYDSYLYGFKKWRLKGGGDCTKEVAERETICKRLLALPDGPCSLPWNLN